MVTVSPVVAIRFGDMPTLLTHMMQFGDTDGTTKEIASERMKDAIKKAAEEAEKSRNWGSVSSSMRSGYYGTHRH